MRKAEPSPRRKTARRAKTAKAAPLRGNGQDPDLTPPTPDDGQRRKRAESVEDPLGDWPQTDADADEWLIDRDEDEEPPDR